MELPATFLITHWPKIAGAIVLLMMVSLLLGVSPSTLVLALAFVVLASFSTFYFNYVSFPINFELVKLFTILIAYTHGIAAGLLVGLLSTFFGKVLIGRIDEKLPLSLAAISVLAIAASIFSPSVGIVALGIILVGTYNVVMLGLSLSLGGDAGWNLPYEGTNFVINLFLFSRIAPLLLPLLGS